MRHMCVLQYMKQWFEKDVSHIEDFLDPEELFLDKTL